MSAGLPGCFEFEPLADQLAGFGQDNAIDFYLSTTRNTAAAKRLLSKTLNGLA